MKNLIFHLSLQLLEHTFWGDGSYYDQIDEVDIDSSLDSVFFIQHLGLQEKKWLNQFQVL